MFGSAKHGITLLKVVFSSVVTKLTP